MNWHERWRTRHAWLAGLAALAGTALVAGAGYPPTPIQLLVLAAAVSLTAIPHGALDHVAAREFLGRRRFGSWLVVFVLGYVALAAAVVAAWAAAPAWGLGLFLALSALHFGFGDLERGVYPRRGRVVAAAVRGGLPIALPIAVHPDAVAPIFRYLLLDAAATADAFTQGAAGAARGVLVAAGVLLGLHLRRAVDHAGHRVAAFEMLALGVAGWFLPPLFFFTLYFCGWHSFRHELAEAYRLDASSPLAGFRALARLAWPPTVATLIGGLVGFFLLRESVSAGAALVRVVFLGLAALTIPHMFVQGLCELRRERRGAVGGT